MNCVFQMSLHGNAHNPAELVIYITEHNVMERQADRKTTSNFSKEHTRSSGLQHGKCLVNLISFFISHRNLLSLAWLFPISKTAEPEDFLAISDRQP